MDFMTKKMPYTFGQYEIPRNGAFLEEDNAYPLVDHIEDKLYPPHTGPDLKAIPAKVSIHAQITRRVRADDLVGEPETLEGELGVTDEILTLTPEAAERIATEVLEHYQGQ